MTPVLCDDCGQPIDGPPFGGIGENLCFICWWLFHEDVATERDYIQQMREALCHCGTCCPNEEKTDA